MKYINNKINQTVRHIFKIKATDLKCHGPKEIKGKLLSDIKIDEFQCDLFTDNSSPESCLSPCPMKVNLEKNLLVVNCQNQNLANAPEKICSVLGHKTELNLRNNLLESIPSMFNENYNHVTRLLLGRNKIRTLVMSNLGDNLEVNIIF